jgi:hypothetical protein
MNQGEDMKFIKYVVAVAFAICLTASGAKAQATVAFLGGGSSALFNELGAATQNISGISCIWSYGKTSSIVARDARFASTSVGNIDEQGNIFVAWGPGSGSCDTPAGTFSIYAYMSLDSVVGDRCYFENDGSGTSGCIQIFTLAANTAGQSKVLGITDNATIPSNVISAIANQHYFVAGTDIRPEDAKWAINRMFNSCNTLYPRQPFNQDSYYTYGLGYSTSVPNWGGTVSGYSGTGGGSFNVANFNITGTDPESGAAVPGYSVTVIGAQPIIVAVAPITDTTGIGAATNINGFTLTTFYQGVTARATDLSGPTVANPVTVLVREPLSGTYNTFEYSIPNGTQYHASQDYGNCLSTGLVWQNPLNYQSANTAVAAYRDRVIGTGGMTAALQAAGSSTTGDTMGYFFWSAGNAKGLTNVKYLTVNGIDPIQTTYSNGVLPGSGGTGDPGLGSNITFAGLNAGNYPIWSPLRLVSAATPPAGVTAMITALHTLDSTQHDYIPLSSLNVWHSHFSIQGVTTAESNGNTINTTGDLCPGGIAEAGGDVGGTNVIKQVNSDFCSDYGVTIGLVNKTQ